MGLALVNLRARVRASPNPALTLTQVWGYAGNASKSKRRAELLPFLVDVLRRMSDSQRAKVATTAPDFLHGLQYGGHTLPPLPPCSLQRDLDSKVQSQSR